jgi:hypothetical protein
MVVPPSAHTRRATSSANIRRYFHVRTNPAELAEATMMNPTVS